MGISANNQRVYDAISKAVEEAYGRPLSYFLAPWRISLLVDVRYIAMYIYTKETKCSRSECASVFNKSHSTVLHGLKWVDNLLRVDANFKQEFNRVYEIFSKNYGL